MMLEYIARSNQLCFFQTEYLTHQRSTANYPISRHLSDWVSPNWVPSKAYNGVRGHPTVWAWQ